MKRNGLALVAADGKSPDASAGTSDVAPGVTSRAVIPHVVLVEPFFHRAGHFPEEVVHLGNALVAAGGRVEVVTPRTAQAGRLDTRAAGVSQWLVDRAPRASGLTRAVLDCLTIWRCMSTALEHAGRDSVVVCVSGRFLAFFAAGALASGRTLVFFSRDFSRVQEPTLVDRILNVPTRLLARLTARRNTVSMVSIVDPHLAREHDSFDLPTVYIPPVGVRPHQTLPGRREARERLGLPVDEPMLLVFGLAHSGKDYDVIFRALGHLRAALRIVFAGAVPAESTEDPRTLKARYDRDDRVIVRDQWIPREDVPLYFAAADGLLLSYRSGYVVDSGVLCEGVAMGRVMVGTREGSIGQALTEWPLGLTFAAGAADELAHQAEALVAMAPAEAARFADGRRRFSERYSWDRIAHEHLDLYRTLLSASKGGRRVS